MIAKSAKLLLDYLWPACTTSEEMGELFSESRLIELSNLYRKTKTRRYISVAPHIQLYYYADL